ncbi:phosphate ABC transporter substrate-binding protein PstS [Asticcacaulis benevestitus]|uniref:Phosphate-binding protein PstS n=1 Tax=Asticcacaulis benevestitus DSM 16100 = ATCC BAA-896 TaxID=1121022 RepID=V4NB84_9CAUL|nr:phosphate ABC transporter substrate-binding protein PstS [Asticcacaulis benevestitus]ESQ79157.1 phosphate ABC transporter substrate-binding protein [Asticcacaulis benevestitus DSM 16100 = ATCC BAA-896]
MQKRTRRGLLTGSFALTVAAGSARALPKPAIVHGAGSTFAYPIIAKWTEAFNRADFRVNGGTKIDYQGVGSGAGIELIKGHKVDFGASDMPLPSAELKKSGLGQFPIVIGGVVPVFNLPGVPLGVVKFTGPILAAIYLGKITKWNDAALVAINAGLPLPNETINVVHRSDGSGTTFNWVNFLSKYSPEWKARVGEGTLVNWPVGTGGKGNDGVGQLVQQTPYSIGYVEYTYCAQKKLTWGLVQNRTGNFVKPSVAAFQKAAEGAQWRRDQDFYLVLTDAPGKDAYPITATTLILLPKKPNNYAANRALLEMLAWALENGQQAALSLDYVPLPDALKLQVEIYWTDIKH